MWQQHTLKFHCASNTQQHQQCHSHEPGLLLAQAFLSLKRHSKGWASGVQDTKAGQPAGHHSAARMSWTLFSWLLIFILQAGLLGRCLYALLSLADLEQDFINPYDLSNRLNKFVMVELGVQISLLVVTLLSRFWFAFLLQVVITGYLVQQYLRRQIYIDATDAFKQLKPQQRWRTVLFGAYCTFFVLVTYRVIETFVHSVLTPEGRELAKKLFKDAAGGMPGY